VVRLTKFSHVFEVLLEGFGIIPYQCHYHFLYLTPITLLESAHKSVKKGFQRLTKRSRFTIGDIIISVLPVSWQQYRSTFLDEVQHVANYQQCYQEFVRFWYHWFYLGIMNNGRS
jgi:hypothetical protein